MGKNSGGGGRGGVKASAARLGLSMRSVPPGGRLAQEEGYRYNFRSKRGDNWYARNLTEARTILRFTRKENARQAARTRAAQASARAWLAANAR